MTESVLKLLKINGSPPTVEYLQQLIIAYCSNIPWESVSKIVKKNSGCAPESCVRRENEFWSDAYQYGTGGTCYESNRAFFCFLQSIGYKGYLTINKIVDKSSVHSAIVIVINGEKYIVDIGYPLYAPIPVREGVVTHTDNYLFKYCCTPISSNEFMIENFPHPKPYLYHFTDIPVHPNEYLKIASKDYGDAGLFADRIIIRKIINALPTRFDSEDIPCNIHTLQNGEKKKTFISDEAIVSKLSEHFNINRKIVSQAFSILNKTNA